MSKKNKQVAQTKIIQTEIPSKIQNLIHALREVGYDISVEDNASGYCIDGKTHGYGIVITIKDLYDGDGYNYELLFTQDGQIIDNYLQLPIIKR